MALFVSHRERRLWTWTLAMVATIYATLGLTGTLAGLLERRGLDAGLFALGMLLVGATVVVQGLRRRSSGVEIGVVLGVAAVYLMVFLRMTLAERSHLIEYGVVASFIYEALKERTSHGGRVPVPPLVAIFGAGLIGAFDEFIQVFLPSRVYDPRRHPVRCPGSRHGRGGAPGGGLGQAAEEVSSQGFREGLASERTRPRWRRAPARVRHRPAPKSIPFSLCCHSSSSTTSKRMALVLMAGRNSAQSVRRA